MKRYIKTKLHHKRFSVLINPNIIKKKNIKMIINSCISKNIIISMSDLCQFWVHENCIKIVHLKDVVLSSIKITSKKVRQNYVDFSPIKISSKKEHWNKIDLLIINNTSNKGRWNDLDFSLVEITSKKYVEATWRFVNIFFSTYLRNIDIESTSIRRAMSAW